MNRYLSFCFLTLIVLVTSLGAQGQVKTFGVIDSIDHEQGIVVIDDWARAMVLNMEVRDKNGVRVTRYFLKKGQKVMFEPHSRAPGKFVQGIWVLPKNAKRPAEEG